MTRSDFGIDIRMLSNTGIGTYIQGLLPGVISSALTEQKTLALFGHHPPDLITDTRIQFTPFISSIYSLTEQMIYPKLLSECKLWHAPHYNIPYSKGKTRLVVTIHDLIHWVFRKNYSNPLRNFYAKTMLERAISTADHILTVSNHTKSDLVKYFQADSCKITVVYEGVSDLFHPQKTHNEWLELKNKYRLPTDNFFLYVGLMKPHKNVHWLIQNFLKIRKKGDSSYSLILTGKLDPKYRELHTLFSESSTHESIIHLPSIQLKELITLYQHATALVHPSLYEGFGLTLLEAQACGTPVIALRTASIPEVVQDSACLIEPHDDHAFQKALYELENNPDTRTSLIDKGFKNIKRFSWQTAAEQTFQVYRKVLGT